MFGRKANKELKQKVEGLEKRMARLESFSFLPPLFNKPLLQDGDFDKLVNQVFEAAHKDLEKDKE